MNLLYANLIFGLLFFLSGCAGLVYQAIWIKKLSLVFGHSALSIATVVGVYMAGLGSGAWAAGKRAHKIKNPILAYAQLEGIVALYGALSFILIDSVFMIIEPFYPYKTLFNCLRVAVGFLVFIVPTFCMGASLPIFTEYFSRQSSLGKVVGKYYGLNTMGAACGVALSGFFLMPKLGMQGALGSAVGMGILVTLIAWVCSRVIELPPLPEATNPIQNQSVNPSSASLRQSILFLSALCGFFGLFSEIVWARLLSPIFGSSTYTFSLILFLFLIGTSGGSLLTSKFTFFFKNPIQWAGLSLFVSTVFILAGLPYINRLPELFVYLAPKTQQHQAYFFLLELLLAGAIIIGPTIFMGVAFPCLVQAHEQVCRGGNSLGIIYALNTTGAIAGSFITGFFFLPYMGVSKAITITSFTIGLLGICVFVFFLNLRPKMRWGIALGALLLIVICGLFIPGLNMSHLQTGHFRVIMKGQAANLGDYKMIFLKDGITSTVSVFRSTDESLLKVNGKTDASTTGDLQTQYLLGHLPMFFHSKAKNVCVIGLGSGATALATSLHKPDSVDVVELEPSVVEASRFFHSVNDGITKNPLVNIHIEDGRSFLKYSKRQYDVIISEPSNPWIAGVGALFTSDFYKDASRKLTSDGIFCQWIQTYELSRPTLNVMLRTLSDIFPHVLIFIHKGDLICLASHYPLHATHADIKNKFASNDIAANLNRINIANPFDLLIGFYGLFPEDITSYATEERNTDDNNFLEFKAPLEMYRGATPSIDIPPTKLIFERYRDRFFNDIPAETLALGLANAIYKNRPFAQGRVEGMLPLIAHQPTLKELERILKMSKTKAAMLSNENQTIQSALYHLNTGKHEKSLSILNGLLENNPKSGKLHRITGRFYMEVKQWDKARRHLKTALEINPEDYESASFLALVPN